MTLADLGDEIDNARCGTNGGLQIAMELGSVGIEAHIENTHEYKWGLKINLKPFAKEELEALLAEYKGEV